MADINELRAARRKKVRAFRDLGVEPYPEAMPKRHDIADVLAAFTKFRRDKKSITIAGRLLGLRTHGGATFLDIRDMSGNMQALVSKKILGPKAYSKIPLFDLGDIVAVSGLCIKTRRGESSIEVKRIRILSKSLRSIPDAWYGLVDVEERFRDREVDFLLNEDSVKRILIRSKFLKALRRGLEKNNFVEVETPILQTVAGGATAEPFKTKLNALDIPLYLRIAPELYLKRLIVGGFERVYEMGRLFRNEGMDRTHNPEFTSLEFYWAYQDLDGLMRFTEKMLSSAVKETLGDTKCEFQGTSINFKSPFRRVKFSALAEKHLKINPLAPDSKKLRARAKKENVPYEGLSDSAILDHLFKKIVLPEIKQPHFVTNYPISFVPLAKKDEDNPELASMFQLVAGGMELVKAYAELNDPDEQRERFKSELKKRKGGDKEAHIEDEDFIRALEYGLPPTAGWGMGIDRVMMLLTDAASIREVIAFPTMRPKKRR